MKTSELMGTALDWVVAKCEGFEIVAVRKDRATFLDHADGGSLNEMKINYSTDWAQGGPIIEREAITTRPLAKARWEADTFDRDGNEFLFDGPTPLIAAMRCYVASKLGDEVTIPEALQ